MQFRVFWSQVTHPSPALSMGFSLGQGFVKAQLPACSSCKLDQSRGSASLWAATLGCQEQVPNQELRICRPADGHSCILPAGHTQTKAWAEPSASLGRFGSKLWAVAVSGILTAEWMENACAGLEPRS